MCLVVCVFFFSHIFYACVYAFGVIVFTFCSSVSTSCFIYSRFMFYAVCESKTTTKTLTKMRQGKNATVLRLHTLNVVLRGFFQSQCYIYPIVRMLCTPFFHIYHTQKWSQKKTSWWAFFANLRPFKWVRCRKCAINSGYIVKIVTCDDRRKQLDTDFPDTKKLLRWITHVKSLIVWCLVQRSDFFVVVIRRHHSGYGISKISMAIVL